MFREEIFDQAGSRQFLQELIDANLRIELLPAKHIVQVIDQERNKLAEFRPPLPFPPMLAEQSLPEYLGTLADEFPPYVIFLVQAGAAALGYFEDGEVLAHKAFKKYMKRHKRGKSQIKFLNTRGKSKAGSRIRLANTIRFFEEVNERLQDWEEHYEPERYLYACTANIWGMLFQSNISPPFEKKDLRLTKIPMDVKVPSFEEMMRVDGEIQLGRLTIYQEEFPFFKSP